jgi:hypothetical protein
MAKTPNEERLIILSGDARRKYSARISFEVERSSYMGEIDEVTMLLVDGKNATLRRRERGICGELNAPYCIDIEGFSTAAEAERAGMITAQSVLFSAVSLNFGLRLLYESHEPPSVLVRSSSRGVGLSVGSTLTSYGGWSSEAITSELIEAMKHEMRDRRTILALELYTSASLEYNSRARFLTAVSAFEPLASQKDLGHEVASFVSKVCKDLDLDCSIPEELKRESVRQALLRLCSKWFPGDSQAKNSIESAYQLRSEILHEGRLADLDIDLDYEYKTAASYLRRIFELEFQRELRVPSVA